MAADYIRLPFVPQVFKERSSVKLEGLVPLEGLEPPTDRVETGCSNPLSYSGVSLCPGSHPLLPWTPTNLSSRTENHNHLFPW